MIDAGMSVARFNMSHGTHDSHKTMIDAVKTARENRQKDFASEYLKDIHQDYVTDSTNLQDEYVRNKIRLNILPC